MILDNDDIHMYTIDTYVEKIIAYEDVVQASIASKWQWLARTNF